MKKASHEFITHIQNWMNTLPKNVLGYKTPQELFYKQMAEINMNTLSLQTSD